ncbi:hypothetical protein CR205_09855 [Alteribacter lacisalsi]|uniref:Uncharacterized protein n=1 Tax=Alteribacter lacisalsi TaxID=2045244 RepID=A0A2W0HP39_9BACI|nr:hypothetical protein [Alteribacter lacisalsi]PYZ98852.1 hypothetical protein CR205_09855 [Alteribacter lacisalsi]
MRKEKLSEFTYGQFQEELIRLTLHRLEEKRDNSPLVYFPIVHEKVETFLIAYWQQAWGDCRDMTWDEWFQSDCFKWFEDEVIKDVLQEAVIVDQYPPLQELSPSSRMKEES